MRFFHSPESRASRPLVSLQRCIPLNHPMQLLKRLQHSKNRESSGSTLRFICLYVRMEFSHSVRDAHLVQWWRGVQRRQWLDCCSSVPWLYPAGRKHVNHLVLCLCVSWQRGKSSYLLTECSSPALLAHLVAAQSTEHFSVSLPLHHSQLWRERSELRGPWFDMELI